MSDDEVFSNSPQQTGIGTTSSSVSATPIQSYLRDQQMMRHQKLADDRRTRLLETQSDLEVAVCQNDILSQENTKLRHDVDKLKHQLENSKNNIFLNPDLDDEAEDEVAELRAHNRRLRYSINEQKDTEKYLKDVEKSLEAAQDQNRQLSSRQTSLEEKLKGISNEKNNLLLQVEEMRGSLLCTESTNATLLETVEEQQKEIEQLRCIVKSSKHKKSLGGFWTPTVGGVSVGDISVDDPQFSPCKDVGGEVIGNNLILDLREDLAKMSIELEREKELRISEAERSKFLAEKVSALETESKNMVNLLTEENRQKSLETERLSANLILDLREDLAKMSIELEREKELRISETEISKFLAEKVSALETETKHMVNLLTEENRQKNLEIERLSAIAEKSLDEEFASRCQEIREECLKESDQKCEEIRRVCKKEEKDALQEQKTRYTARVKEVTDKVQNQYKTKMEECVSKWKSDVATKKLQIEELKKKLESSEKAKDELQKKLELVEGKYELAKQKLSQIVERNELKENALTHDRDQLLTKYAAAKKIIATLETQIVSQKLVIEQQRKELSQNKSETVAKSSSDVFKHPAVVIRHTPGRTKPSRTQSEASMPRRPPSGVGSLFAADDEAGEMFSSSYLHDLKDGRCLVGSGDLNSRISELSRRNTMVPMHLQSSYPAETQFHAVKEFTDDDLRLGKILVSPGRSSSETTSSRQSISRRQSLATLNVERSNVKKSVADVKRKKVTPEVSPRVSKRLRKAEESPAALNRSNRQSRSSPNLSFESPVMATSNDKTPSSKKLSSASTSKTPSSLRKLLSRLNSKSKNKEESPVTSFTGSSRKKFLGLRK